MIYFILIYMCKKNSFASQKSNLADQDGCGGHVLLFSMKYKNLLQKIYIFEKKMQASLLIESPDLNIVSAQDQMNQRAYFQNQTYRAVELSLRQQQNPLKSNKRNGLNQKYRKLIPNMKMVKSHQVCTICLCNFQKGQIIKKLPCRHIYHRMCAKEWLRCNKKCAVCRMDLQEYFAIKEKELQKSQLPQQVASEIQIKQDKKRIKKELQNLKTFQQHSNLNGKISGKS